MAKKVGAQIVERLLHAASGPQVQTVPQAHGPFGYSATNPIPVQTNTGEADYLRMLQCACGTAFLFHRVGNAGPGPDGHVVDVFELVCRNRVHHVTLYFDMYHRGASTLLPDGLQRGATVGTGVTGQVTPFPDGLPAVLAHNAPPPVWPSFVRPPQADTGDTAPPEPTLNLAALDATLPAAARATFQRIIPALGDQPTIPALLEYVVRYRGTYLHIDARDAVPPDRYGYVVALADCDLVAIPVACTDAHRLRAVLHLVMHLLLDQVPPYQTGAAIRMCGPTQCQPLGVQPAPVKRGRR